MKGTVAILFRESHISVSPTVYNLSKWLSKNYKVLILCENLGKGFVNDDFIGDNIFIHYSGKDYVGINLYIDKPEVKKNIIRKLIPKKLRDKFFLIRKIGFSENKNLKNQFDNYLKFVSEFNLKYNFDLIIAIDTLPLVVCGKLGLLKKTIYLSLEILFYKDIHFSYARKIKKLEKNFINKVKCIITQDEFRKTSLIRENNIKLKEFIILPNSSSSKINLTTNRFFHNKFNLPENAKVVLSAGMISDASLSYDIAKNFAESVTDNNVYLIFHERLTVSENHPYIKKILQLNHKNILLSLQPVSYGEIDNIFASCDIGLVFYNTDYGANYSLIAGASGKLSQFLKLSKPIISNNLLGFHEILNVNKTGYAIKNFDELYPTIQKILSNYTLYSTNAFKTFNDNFNFEEKVKALQKYLN